MDTTTKNKITDNISDNTKRENEKEGEDLKIHESTEDDKGIQEIPDIKLENKKEVCPNFNILSSCFISNKGCLKLGTDFKPNNDDKNGKLANMKESNNSEQDKIISPLFNDNSKNAFIQSSQPILNKNIINNNDNHLMDNCGDNKVFDDNFPFDFCQYQDNSKSFIENAKIKDFIQNNTFDPINKNINYANFCDGINSFQNKNLNDNVFSSTKMTYPSNNINSTINNINHGLQFIPITLNDKIMNSNFVIPSSLSMSPFNTISWSDINLYSNSNNNNSINSSFSVNNPYFLNNKNNNSLAAVLGSNSNIINHPVLWNINNIINNSNNNNNSPNTNNNNNNNSNSSGSCSNPNDNLKLLSDVKLFPQYPDELCFISNLALNQNPMVNENMLNYMKNNSNNNNTNLTVNLMNQNNSLNFDRSNRKSNLFLNKPLNLYDDNFIPRSSTEVLNPNLINHDLNVFDEEDESDFLYNSLNYNLKSENISDPDQDGGIRDVFAKNIPKTILDQDLMSLYHQNNCDIEGGVSTTNKIDNLNLFNLFNDNPIKNESLLNDSYLSNSSNPKIVPSSLLINPFQNDMPFNSSQSSSNKLSDDDDDNNISSIIKINKYGEKKSSIDRNGGNHSMNKEWLKGKLKNIKQKKVKRFHKKKSSSSQSTLTFNNFEKECLDKLSPISDPLISLSAMSLAKPVRDSDLKEIPSSHLSLDSITSENISKSKINLHHHYTDKVLGEKEGSFSYFGFENTLINNEKDNHDLVENTENVDKNGGPNDTKKNNDKGKNSRNLSKNKNEIILSSHIKNNINLGQMKLTMNNDPEIIHDTTSSFLFILEDADLWKKFNSVVNEMIITKSGRCLFPILKFQPINLEPKVQYSFAIDILQASPYKYKYRDKKWISGGIKFFAPPTQKKEYYHPDSPQSGHFWMTHGVSFSKIKLTNHIKSISENGQSTKKSAMLEEYNDTINGNNDDNNNSSNDNKEIIVKHKSTKLNVINSIARLPENHFYLSSFFMYEPCLYLIRHDADKKYVSTIKFNETKFLAVTHYQNEKVNQLKKNYNPHAKGFKDDLYKTKKRNRKEKKKSKSGEEEDKQQKYPSHLLNESINETDACYKSLIKEYENYNTPMPQKNSRISISENYFKGNENTMMTLNLSEINRKETIGLPKHSYKRKLVKKKYQTNKDGKTPHFFNKLIGNLGNDNYKISKTFQKSSKESFDHHYHHHHQHHQYSIHPLFINDDKNNSLESSKESWLKNKETVLTMPSQLSMEVTPSTISLLNSTTKSKSPNLDFSSLLLLPNQDSLMDNTLNYNDQFNDALMVENIDLDGLLKTTTIPSLPSPFNEPNNTTTINPFNDTTTISNNNDNNDNSNGERNKNNNSSTDFNINDTFLLNKDNTFTLIDDSKSNKENMEDLSPSLNLLLNMNNYMSNQTERDQKI